MDTIDPRLLRLAENLRRAFQASGLTKDARKPLICES